MKMTKKQTELLEGIEKSLSIKLTDISRAIKRNAISLSVGRVDWFQPPLIVKRLQDYGMTYKKFTVEPGGTNAITLVMTKK